MSRSVDATPANPTMGFANAGHLLAHLLVLVFPTVALALEREWRIDYAELIVLMLPGQLLLGLGALPAGWLADRWSTLGMITVFFVGSGLAAIGTGLATGPASMAVGLSLIGLFTSIYHPVAIPWLIRSSKAGGRAVGLNGVFGPLGIALAPIVAGVSASMISWRAAFIVPGANQQ